MRELTFPVPPNYDNAMVKSFLRGYCGISARLLVRLKRIPNGITADGVQVRSIDHVHAGQTVRLLLPEDEVPAEAQNLPIDIVYEDDDLLILNKPPYMPVHPSPGHAGDTLANAAAHYLQSRGQALAFRPVNRLDRDTSGLLVAAKHAHAAYRLAGKIDKEYIAVCEGVLQGCGTIDLPIRIKPGHSIQREVGPGGLPAVTHWRVLGEGNAHTLLSLHLDTGRTHQIRVHLSHIGHPLAGDDMYGGSRGLIGRQALHCVEIHFMHPVTQKTVEFISPLPEDMKALLQNTGLSKYTI